MARSIGAWLTDLTRNKKLFRLGVYPTVSLADARNKRSEACKLHDNGIDPSQAKRVEKTTRATNAANIFEAVAREWHSNKLETWQERTARNILHRLEKDIFPTIGHLPIAHIKAPTILDALQQIEKRGAIEMARRQRQVCSQIFRYAVASGRAETDPVQGLRGALKPRARKHHAAITTDELPDFLRAIEANEAKMSTPIRIMLRLIMLVFVRTSELTQTPWSEIDFENKSWVIPWQRMKMGRRKVNLNRMEKNPKLIRAFCNFLRWG